MNLFLILWYYGFIFGTLFCFFPFYQVNAIRKYSKEDLLKLREEVRQMFDHAYTGYLKYAYPYDELRPLTCDGIDTWGSYSLTLIDALDTLAVMGNYSEFKRVVDIVTTKANFDANINVSVFETNIRIVGGLLSAHLLSQRAGVDLEPGWPCNGPLLRLAEDVARRLLTAFDTPSGMPYGTVNLRHGVPPGETTVTCTAGVGTFILEFGTLSRLTGDPVYEEVALNALHSLFERRSGIGLFGNHIDISSGRWVALDSGIGAGVDSFFEYLVKGAILLDRPELMAMFKEVRKPVDRYLKKNHWYVWASMHKGQVTLPVFQSLEAYWPGVLSLIGDIDTALRSMHNYNRVWKQYGFTPEFYNIAQGEAGSNRESYPLRPELAESAMYLYRATGDTFMLDIGLNILRSLQHSAKTPCGYATIKDARDHTQENRMESFFLAETTKYLYLLFDPENFIHNDGSSGKVHVLPSGRQCVLDAGGYIFNTEAHPIDPGALRCCYEWKEEKDFWKKSKNSKGDILSSRKKEKKVGTENSSSKRYEENETSETSKLIVQGADENFQNQSNDHFEVTDEDDSNDGKSSLSEEVEKLSKHTETLNHLLNIVKASHESVSIKRENGNEKSGEDGPTFSQNSSESPVLEWPPNSTLSQPSTSEREESLPEYVRELVGLKSAKKEFDPQQLLESIRTSSVDASLNSLSKYQLLTCPAQPFHIRLTIAGEFIEEK
ncbi:ER degradation-enhancing alpha-mannosidase-like protein 2 [Halyomorpha halys]|uniref:ER degradation-enhancing alpha-mannosidase-like protein 2 n=1 Tax=Halyomorpha halys TaxID=286706 RepID=UPI0006D4FF19|nr:ER degradation-enhancing alpha-mannosidase-like protein 2 [Halyomorpha halys]